ncbi:MAG: helix-turn-helix transcriptional regulator [Terriglobales bacterium]
MAPATQRGAHEEESFYRRADGRDPAGGWRLDESANRGFPRDELPGIWLSARECYALLTLYRVLRGIDPGFLDEFVSPLAGLLKRILDTRKHGTHGFSRKVEIQLGQLEKGLPNLFARVSEALVGDWRLELRFQSEDGKALRREMSPQRIVLTASGWHLHALDHQDGNIRIVALPAIKSAKVMKTPAERHPQYEMDNPARPRR